MGADFSSFPTSLGLPTSTSLPGVFPASVPAACRPRLGHAAGQRDGVRVRPYHFPEFAGRGSLRDRRVSLLAHLPGFRLSVARLLGSRHFRQFHLHHWSWPVFLSRRPALT